MLGSQDPYHIPQEAIRYVNLLLPHGGEKICSALDSLWLAIQNKRTITFDPSQFSAEDVRHIHELRYYRVELVRRWFQNSMPAPRTHQRLGPSSTRTRSDALNLLDSQKSLPAPTSSSYTSVPSSQAGAGHSTSNRDRTSVVERSETTVRPRATRFGCTVCGNHLSDAQGWKNHEKVQHERDEEWTCDICEAPFRRRGDFMKHHDGHGCHSCKAHITSDCGRQRLKGSPGCSGCRCAEKAHKVLFVPTAYACGFCGEILRLTWNKRCSHINKHFYKGEQVADWDHSKVIRALIFGRVDLKDAFMRCQNDSRSQNQFYWDKENTDELLRELKCWKPGEGKDPLTLGQRAYSLSKTANFLSQSDSSSQEHPQAVGFTSYPTSTTQLDICSSRDLDLLGVDQDINDEFPFEHLGVRPPTDNSLHATSQQDFCLSQQFHHAGQWR